MHQVIGHAGTCQWLDCWRVHVSKKYSGITSLEAFATTQPTFDNLKSLADEIALAYVADHTLVGIRCKSHKEQDMQFENSLLLNRYFLLYEELSYAMNRGDIG